MDVWHLTAEGAARRRPADLADLLDGADGFVWVDVTDWDAEVADVLVPLLGLHPMAVETCARRNYLPTAFPYPGHLMLVFLGLARGTEGHIHLLEYDAFLADRCLVTVQGPHSSAIAPESTGREVTSALRRIQEGRFRPTGPADVLQDLLVGVGRHYFEVMSSVAAEVAQLEHTVRDGDLRNPEPLMDEMFMLRHELQVVMAVAAHTQELMAYVVELPQAKALLDRAAELGRQFAVVRRSADSEREYLAGVIDLYQTRVSTKMTVAAERLSVVAALTLPVTAISSVLGMNVIVSDSTRPVALTMILAVMLVISALLLRWTRRQGWW